MEKVTFDDILRLKLRREEQQSETLEIAIPALGKSLEFKSPTCDQQLDFISAVRTAGGVDGSYDAYRKLVYDCCPMLHSDKLHAEMDVRDPYDVVDMLFTPIEVMDIGDKICDRFFKVSAEIKN
ncbi:MAG: hypothetical protein HFE63_00975 [Clostridiales bacterium]|nr:hypothetical protein [Clostridiales bacterium]